MLLSGKARQGPKELYYYLSPRDKQLADAVAYAHSIGVAMKGDIPIGISPDSVDAYIHPELFNLDASAGAPPDDFSISGQNWGFPTYNWDEMAKDGFLWWRKRFQKMQDYFDAYRIDHILGFFRIWQMRKCDVWGLCGHFVPALPYSAQDLWNMGVCLDVDRMVKPYIRANFLGDVFGYDTEIAKERFLRTNDGYVYYFPEEFDTQVKVEDYFKHLIADDAERKAAGLSKEQCENIRNCMIYLHCEVLFVQDQRNPEMLHPRISIYQSHSFNELYTTEAVLMESTRIFSSPHRFLVAERDAEVADAHQRDAHALLRRGPGYGARLRARCDAPLADTESGDSAHAERPDGGLRASRQRALPERMHYGYARHQSAACMVGGRPRGNAEVLQRADGLVGRSATGDDTGDSRVHREPVGSTRLWTAIRCTRRRTPSDASGTPSARAT